MSKPFYKKVFMPLMSLPAYISLSYIEKHMQEKLGLYDLTEAESAAQDLNTAVNAFKNFMLKLGLIETDKIYVHPASAANRNAFEWWLECFQKMPPMKNKLFFSIIAKSEYASVPLNIKQSLIIAWHENKIVDTDGLLVVLELARKITSLNQPVQDFMSNQLEDLMNQAKVTDERIKKHEVILEITKNNSELLGSLEFNSLCEQWINGEVNEQVLLQSTEILRLILEFNRTYPNIDVISSYQTDARTEANNQQYLDFLRALNNPEYSQLNEDAIRSLWSAWYERRIASISELKDAVELVKQMMLLFPRDVKGVMLWHVNGNLFKEARITDANIRKCFEFVRTIQNQPSSIDSAWISILYNYWMHSTVKAKILDLSFAVLFQIRGFAKKFENINLLQEYRAEAKKDEFTNQRYLNFLELINKPENEKLSQKHVTLLWRAWGKRGLLGLNGLTESVEIIKHAMQLSDEDTRNLMLAEIDHILKENHPPIDALKRLDQFITAVKQQAISITLPGAWDLYEKWRDGKIRYEQDLHQSLKVLVKLEVFAKHYSRLGFLDEYKASRNSEADNQHYLQFLDVLNKSENEHVDIAIIRHLWQAWRAEKLDRIEALEQVITIAKKITSLTDERTVRFMRDMLIDALYQDDRDIIHSLDKIELFIKIINQDARRIITLPGFEDLYQKWLRSHFDETVLKQSFEVLIELEKFKQKFHFNNLFEDYEYADKEESNQRYLDFLTILNQAENDNLPQNTMFSLWRAWYGEQLKNSTDLLNAIEVAKQAMDFQQQGNWSDLFVDLDCDNQRQRLAMMQHLHHGMLDLGEGFSERCYGEYTKLALHGISNIANVSAGNRLQQQKIMSHSYQKIFQFTQELRQVAQHPYARPGYRSRRDSIRSENGEDTCQLRRRYSEDFHKHQRNYASFWMKNKARKTQATDLFNTLNNNDRYEDLGDEKRDYYLKTLGTIWDTQQRILREDVGTKHNKKGYSRLYDITVKMFVKVAHDFLADEGISIDDRAGLNEMLQKQLKFHVDLIERRLPENHSLRSTINQCKLEAPLDNPWSPGSTQLVRLQNCLQQSLLQNYISHHAVKAAV